MVYINSNSVKERVYELKQFWDKCIWFKIKQKSSIYLIGLFYSPRTSDRNFFEGLNQNLEKATELTKHVIVRGDLSEDLRTLCLLIRCKMLLMNQHGALL